MARKRPTIVLRNDRAGRNARKRPASAVSRAKTSFGERVNWSTVRIVSVSLVFAGLWILLWVRAYQLQIMRGPQLAEKAKRAHVATEMATGRRGSIVDRNGSVLAKSVEALSVAVRPAKIQDKAAASALLVSALGISPAKAKEITGGKRPFVWAARKVGPRTAEMIQKAKTPGVFLQKEYARVYPFKHLAGQLLGFVDVDEKGIEGLERAFDETLSGQKKRLVMQRDAAGRRLYANAGQGFTDLTGDDVRLTIDTQVQYFAESALLEGVDAYGARWAGCMVVDVPTGDVLAWAEYPFFNPNKPAASSPFERRNKTAMDALEQGSTIKPFLMAAALQEKIITPESEYDCEQGKWKLRNVTIRDTSVHAVLPAKEILKVSSNIGVAKIGLELGTAKYHNYLSQLGFGVKTGLPLAGENKGIVRAAKQWGEVDLASASFGQSFSATILQMAKAYLCLANDGLKKDLRLVVSDDAQPTRHDAPERIFSEEVVWQVREMMRSVVEDSGGTGRRARIEGIAVGGKTGTAQKASGDSYGAGRVASFVGMLPIEAPRYLVVVILDEPVKNQYGGVIAAPVFKNVALRTMAYHALLPDSTPSSALNDFKRERADAVGESETAFAAQAAPVAGERSAGAEVASPSGKAGRAPSVVGMSVRKAIEAFARQGVVPEIKGEGNLVVRQTPDAGTVLPRKTGADAPQCVIWLGERS